MNGIATTLISQNPGKIRPTAPPRAALTQLNRGATIGQPHDIAQQRRILEATLALLAQEAPIDLVRLNENANN